MTPRKFDKGERPFNKFRKDQPRSEEEGERSFHKPFHRDSRPDFGEEEQFVSTGELADIVGTHPLDRREILRRMWRHYQDAGLVKSIGGGRPPRSRTDRPPYERSERPARDRDDRGPRRFEDRPPRRFEGERAGAPRRYGPKPEDGDRRFSRDRDEGPKRFSRKPSQGPRVSTRKPSGKHPAGKRAEFLSKIPHRKFKDTREREEG